MNIKVKLSLQFTLIVFAILIFFAGLVYYFFHTSQVSKFHELLRERAENTAILLINVKEVDSTLLKTIHRSTISLEKEEIMLTDSSMNPLYDNNILYLNDDVVRKHTIANGVTYFTIGDKDAVSYVHRYKNRVYHVFVAAYDASRHYNQSELLKILIWSVMISIWLSVYLSYLFSRNAIQPISRIIKSVKAISSSKLNSRLDEGNRKDEIAQLAITFNEMLKDLESAFRNQEDFISNASHELRTPLSIMMIEADYFLSKEHPEEEYQRHISGLMEDIRKINALLNSLLEVAHLNRDNQIQLLPVRIDEIILTAIRQVKIKFNNRRIVPRIGFPEDQDELLVLGDAGLLTIAFKNLIENACKFSSDDVLIEVDIQEYAIRVVVHDKGIGIPEDEMGRIFEPFNRASNVKFKSGFGIGLSLVARIMDIHHADMKVISKENAGTSFNLVIKKAIS